MNIPQSGPSKEKLDPLYVIFEQHLYNFQDSEIDRKTFIGNVIREYFTYLRRMNISIPKSLEQPIMEELAGQVNTMLVKKIYGCLTIQDYQRGLQPATKKRVRKAAKARFSKISPQKKKLG